MKKQYQAPIGWIIGREITDLLTDSLLGSDPYAPDLEWEGL